MKRIFSALLAVILISGCSSGEQGAIRIDVANSPRSLDPQAADNTSETLIIANAFEGLVRVDDQEGISAGCAESWEISPDGLTYTFKLREGIQWENGEAVVAEDFVFGLQRLLDPQTNSPNAEKYTAIKNADEVLAGKLPVSELGVISQGEDIVIIQLSKQEKNMLGLLAQPAAMPCSKIFFQEQKGRYGLSKETILGNGALVVSGWSESLVTLSPSTNHRSNPEFSNLYICINRGDPTQLFLEERSELCYIPFEKIVENQLGGKLAYDQSWSIIINPNSVIGKNPALRKALMSSVSIDDMGERVAYPLKPSQGFIPESVMISNEAYRSISAPVKAPPTYSQPMEEFRVALEQAELEKLPKTDLITAEFAPFPELGGMLQKMWSQKLSIYINMEQLSSETLLSRVSKGNFDIALSPVTLESGNIDSYFYGFSHCEVEYKGETTTVGQVISQLNSTYDKTQLAEGYLELEQELIDAHYILPLFDAPFSLVISPRLSGVKFDNMGGSMYFGDAVLAEK